MAFLFEPDAGIHVEVEGGRQPGGAGILEFGFLGERGTRSGIEFSEVAVERGLGGSVPGLVVHDQRRIEGEDAFAGRERGDGVDDVGVILGGTDVQESTVGVDGRDTGLVFLSPSEIEPNEVHGATVP